MLVLESRGTADVAAFRALVEEHAAALAATLPGDVIARIRSDASSLPGLYAPPSGAIVLAWTTDESDPPQPPPLPAGGGALHALDEESAEIKRMFVRPAYRGLGLGGRIVGALVDAARARGYQRVRLGTIPSMHAAVALYQRHGFVTIPRYRADELSPDTLFFERALVPAVDP